MGHNCGMLLRVICRLDEWARYEWQPQRQIWIPSLRVMNGCGCKAPSDERPWLPSARTDPRAARIYQGWHQVYNWPAGRQGDKPWTVQHSYKICDDMLSSLQRQYVLDLWVKKMVWLANCWPWNDAIAALWKTERSRTQTQSTKLECRLPPCIIRLVLWTESVWIRGSRIISLSLSSLCHQIKKKKKGWRDGEDSVVSTKEQFRLDWRRAAKRCTKTETEKKRDEPTPWKTTIQLHSLFFHR